MGSAPQTYQQPHQLLMHKMTAHPVPALIMFHSLFTCTSLFHLTSNRFEKDNLSSFLLPPFGLPAPVHTNIFTL